MLLTTESNKISKLIEDLLWSQESQQAFTFFLLFVLCVTLNEMKNLVLLPIFGAKLLAGSSATQNHWHHFSTASRDFIHWSENREG